MSFLSSLGKAINEQYGFGENSVTSLDTVDDKGRVKPFGLLGNFANKIDQAAQRSYIEDGFIRNVRPNLREAVWQQPDACVLIKKRMFSSLSENYKLDTLEENEKLFIRASKKLFQNKCRVISAYERLTKIESLALDGGVMNSYMFPTLMNGVAELENAGVLNNIMDQKTRSIFETLRQVHVFSEPNSTTTWLIDNETPFMSSLGEGTGVIELTMVTSVSTKTSVNFAQGGGSFTMEDPYKMFIITRDDIDVAIRDATNYFKNSAFGKFTEIETQKLIEDQKSQLNKQRLARGASSITIVLTPVTIVSKKIRAILDGGLVGDEGLGDRPTPEINFTFNPGLAGFGSDVNIDPIALRGKNGLNPNDANLFKEVIRNIYQLLAFQQDTRNNIVQFNKDMNYVRRKMMLHFNGRPMIQPMDTVNIFMTSRTMRDEKIIQGFDLQSRGLTFANKLNSLVRNINTLSDKYGGNAHSLDELEKAQIAGPDFPTWLWRLYRNDFTKQAAGTSTFVGIVKNASHSYSANEGKYTLNVNYEDNAGYFNKSQINTRPSLDTFNSNLYDPLTPFKISFDGASGDVLTDVQQGSFPELLNENAALLESEAVRFVNGRFRGQKADSLLYKAQDGELFFNDFRRVLNDPNGFVYRWKEGIGSLTKTENAYPPSSVAQELSPLLTANPFAGQDVMNVLSLLITGQPYNYNTFLQAAIDNANSLIKRNDQTNTDSTKTYIDSLTQQLSKRNVIWGNFVPFKKLVINEAANSFIRSGQADFITQNSALNDLINQRAALQDQKALYISGATPIPARDSKGQIQQTDPGAPTPSFDVQNINTQISLLDKQIDAAKNAFTTTITNLAESRPNGGITIIGDDISLNPSLSNSTAQTEEQRNSDSEEFRLKINSILLRRLWKVKANEDQNLFVVDDQYDKSFDIQAFERKLAGKQELLKSEYSTIEQQIKSTADLLGLEIFADTQGHIQVRPPLYNRVPSSVFYRMFRDKERHGFQVFPQFLENLLFNQFQSQVSRIEIIEDEIRLRALALGVVPPSSDAFDSDAFIAKFLRGSQGNMDQTSGSSVDLSFAFVSDPQTGKIGGDAFQKFITQSQPDLNEGFINQGGLTPQLDQFSFAAKATRLFDAVSRANIVSGVTNTIDTRAIVANPGMIDTISSRLAREKGVQAPTIRDLFSNTRLTGSISSIDVLKVTNEIAVFVSERQKILLSASNVIKNLTQGIQLNDQKKGATAALFPSLNQQNSIPSILQHMIEHEDNHDLGPGSGDRFVIKEHQILSLKIEETPPPHTLVTVNGLLGDGFINPPSELGLTADGGNAVTSAFAVDYDMWRMYGFRSPKAVSAPFFSDPDSQCAPYAVYLLNLARKEILQGSIDLVGNEFYQPGDVVYIENYDLLFYVTDVSHSFGYAGNFTTSLTLKYGHSPGEYIPTQLDIVGTFLYKTKEYTNYFRSSRFDNNSDGTSVSVVTFNNSSDNLDTVGGQTVLEKILSGNVGQQNIKAMTQMLFSTTGALSPISFIGQQPVLELRIYTNSKTQGPVNSNLNNAANAVKTWLQNPQKTTANQSVINIHKPNEGSDVSGINVKIRVVDVSSFDPNSPTPSPSSGAWHAVRTLLEQNSMLSDSSDVAATITKQQDQMLYTSIIDAFLTFVTVDNSISTGTKPTNSQASQADAAALQNAATNFGQFGLPTAV